MTTQISVELISLKFITFLNTVIQSHDQLYRTNCFYLGTGGRARGGHLKDKRETKINFCQGETSSDKTAISRHSQKALSMLCFVRFLNT